MLSDGAATPECLSRWWEQQISMTADTKSERERRVESTADRQAGEPSALVHLGVAQKPVRKRRRTDSLISTADLPMGGQEKIQLRGKKKGEGLSKQDHETFQSANNGRRH